MRNDFYENFKMEIDLSSLTTTGLPCPDLLNEYRLKKERIIYIEAEIGPEVLEISKEIVLFNILDKNVEIEKRQPIRILLNTPGGALIDCFSLVDTIKMSKTPIYTYNAGSSYSAGAVILVAGHKRFAFKNSEAMIHQLSAGMQGTAHEMQQAQKRFDVWNKRMFNFIYEHTSIDKKSHAPQKLNDWYLNSEAQLKYGLVDELVESAEELYC